MKTRVSIVSYLNSKPFLYGLTKSLIFKDIELSIDFPSKVAEKLILGQADIGLIPVGALKDLRCYEIISDFCIGAFGNVRTVVLASDRPLNKIDTILLDYQSRTSVLLARVLAKFFWKKQFTFKQATDGFENNLIKGSTAGVVIGDRVFNVEKIYSYNLDLSEEWVNYTGLPFVFAVWVANKNVSEQFKEDFNNALKFGIKNISEIAVSEKPQYPEIDIFDYFSRNLDFNFDDKKREGLERFLELAKSLG